MTNVLAIDIGGTNCRVMLKTTDRVELDRFTTRTDKMSVLATVNAIKHSMHARNWYESYEFGAIGIAVAGNVDAGVLTGSGNLPGWKDHNLQIEFRDVADVPIAVANDCAAAALGEYVAFHRPLVYVIWGTGVGVAVVDAAGTVRSTELGHMVVSHTSKIQCGCGGFGHLEALVSGGNLQKRFGDRFYETMTKRQWSAVISTMAAGLRTISSGELGVPIVLGGGLIHKQSARLPMLQQMVASLASSAPVPMLSFACYGEDSGLQGATELALRLTTS